MKTKIITAIVITALLAFATWGLIPNSPSIAPTATPSTALCVTNQTDDTVLVWLTLSVYGDTMGPYYVQDVQGIFGIPNSGSIGSFLLAPNDTLCYQSTLALSGNLCFGGQPVNCPSTQFPTATNIFEFTLNNNACGEYQQESVEISCVAGVNSYLKGRLLGDGWIVTTNIDTVRYFANDTLGNNRNRYGVFPTGCTNCTNQQGAPSCSPALTFEAPNDQPICIIQRPANLSGGSVICTFNGFTK